MPRQQVYGKRARSRNVHYGFDNLDHGEESKVLRDITEQVSNLAVSTPKGKVHTSSHRKTTGAESETIAKHTNDRVNTRLVQGNDRHVKVEQLELTAVSNSVRSATAPIDSDAVKQPEGSFDPSRADTEWQENASDQLPPLSDPIIKHLAPITSLATGPTICFAAFDAALSKHLEVRKIAEATYSQVFLLTPAGESRTVARKLAPSVLKLVPLVPPTALLPTRSTKVFKELLELSSKPSHVASEVRLLQHLTQVPGHTTFRALHILQGKPGTSFTKAYKAYDAIQREAGKATSYFPNPARKTSYRDSQLWAVIEMADAGVDLERFMETAAWAEMGIWAVWDVFWQVACAYAKGEVAAQWETRDGHCGNICVRQMHDDASKAKPQVDRQDDNAGVHVEASARFMSAKRYEHQTRRHRKVGCSGLEVTVIDYTISRATIPGEESTRADPAGAEVAFNDLEEDPALFQGNGEDDYQYDIYRCMRAAAFLDDPLAVFDGKDGHRGDRSSWRDYHPETNVVWLHFVLHKILERHRWRPSGGVDDGDDDRLPDAVEQRELQMEAVMRELSGLLDLKRWHRSGLRSAGDLVALALKRGWIEVEDVVGMVGEPKARSRRTKARKTIV